MDNLPATWTALCLLAFGLGMKHGFDADHLATIDGITRYNAPTNPRLARVVGTLFSLGHGAIVLLVALAAGSLSSGWQTPAWLEVTGIGVSIVFLFGLAFVNVRAVVTAEPGAIVAPAGFKGRLLGRFVTVRRAWAVGAVGALFALSFDTVSQAALNKVAVPADQDAVASAQANLALAQANLANLQPDPRPSDQARVAANIAAARGPG